jgi:hypothetical protein
MLDCLITGGAVAVGLLVMFMLLTAVAIGAMESVDREEDDNAAD